MKRSTSLHRTWPTWTGTEEDFSRVFQVVDRLGATRRDQRLDAIASRADSSTDNDEESPFERDYKAKELERRKTEVRKEFETKVSLETDDEVIDGRLDDVMAEFDDRTYRKLTIVTGRPPYSENSMKLIFTTAHAPSWQQACELTIVGADRGWSKQAMVQISEELDKGVRKWNFFYKPFGLGLIRFTLSLTCYFTAIFLVIAAFRLFGEAGAFIRYQISASIGALLFAVFFVGLFSGQLLRKTLPPFEIYRSGGLPKGSGAVKYVVGSLLVPFLIALLFFFLSLY